ncbi:hypothetical protein ACJQWK_11916 [Exserohilum turcicum]
MPAECCNNSTCGSHLRSILTVATGVDVALATRYGLGYHTATLQVETMIAYAKCFFVLIILYNHALTATKIAFLLQYRRVFLRTKMRLACNIGIGIVALWGLLQVLLTVFFCKPISGFWDVTIEAQCFPRLPLWYINSVFNIVSDIVIFVLPLPGLRTLQLVKAQKRVLIGVFCLGFFICAISIVRIQTLKEAAVTKDPTWNGVAAACWSMAELGCGIICLCIPTLRPLAMRLFPGMLQSNLGRGAEGYEMHPDSRDIHVKRDFDVQGSKDSLCPDTHFETNQSSASGASRAQSGSGISVVESTG